MAAAAVAVAVVVKMGKEEEKALTRLQEEVVAVVAEVAAARGKLKRLS